MHFAPNASWAEFKPGIQMYFRSWDPRVYFQTAHKLPSKHYCLFSILSHGSQGRSVWRLPKPTLRIYVWEWADCLFMAIKKTPNSCFFPPQREKGWDMRHVHDWKSALLGVNYAADFVVDICHSHTGLSCCWCHQSLLEGQWIRVLQTFRLVLSRLLVYCTLHDILKYW